MFKKLKAKKIIKKMEELKAERIKLEADYEGTDDSAIDLSNIFELMPQIEKDRKLHERITELKREEMKLYKELRGL